MIWIVLALVTLSVGLQLVGQRRGWTIAHLVGAGLGALGVAIAFSVAMPASTRLISGILAAAVVLQLLTRRSRRD